MRQFLKLLYFVPVLFGCGQGDYYTDSGKPIEYRIAPVNTVSARMKYAQEFPILSYPAGNESRPVVNDGTSPPVVVLEFRGPTRVAFCSGTHARPGKVITNAHCIRGGDASDVYVVGYGDGATKRAFQVTSLGHIGSVNGQDLAVLNLSTDARMALSAVRDATIVDTSGAVGKDLGDANFDVTLWSFDPVDNYPGIVSKIGRETGMVFRPNDCTAFRTKPTIKGIRFRGPATDFSFSSIDERIHVILDRCTREPISGNSGSLISLRNDIRQQLGVFHSSHGVRDSVVFDYTRFEYTGSSGVMREIAPALKLYFFHAGTAFKEFLDANPGSF